MDMNTVFELHRRGLITDEVLAECLNEKYGQKNVEKTWEEKREEAHDAQAPSGCCRRARKGLKPNKAGAVFKTATGSGGIRKAGQIKIGEGYLILKSLCGRRG